MDDSLVDGTIALVATIRSGERITIWGKREASVSFKDEAVRLLYLFKSLGQKLEIDSST